jgi:23S rRNA (guanosine2251-2'-O)-methyltransferase
MARGPRPVKAAPKHWNKSDARRQGREGPLPGDRDTLLVGRHAVIEALRRGRPVAKIWVRAGGPEGSLRELLALAGERNVPVSPVPRARLDMLGFGLPPHQGVIAQVAAQRTIDLDDLIIQAANRPDPVLLILDSVQDPHNFGAILRVADAAGFNGVIIPERGSVGITAAVAKASAGASEFVPVARVSNLVHAIETLKREGYFVYAAHAEGGRNYTTVDWTGRIGLVIGSEGSGVRPLVRDRSDGLVAIPMRGHIASLSASTAAAVVAFEIVRQRVGGERPPSP